MHQINLNYQQDLLSEADQAAHLPQLSALLDNPWWKHFIAEWLKERERCREAVCEYAIPGIAALITMLQTRGEANAYDAVTRLAYDKYEELVEAVKESERQ